MPPTLTRLFNPWKYRREERERQVAVLRERDGDNCTRCRRPLRFDLPDGHDLAPRIEQVVPSADGSAVDSANQVLCHGRCHGVGADNTAEVQERIRRNAEAELLSRGRNRAGGGSR